MKEKKKKRVRFILYLVAVSLLVCGALHGLRIRGTHPKDGSCGLRIKSTINNQQSVIKSVIPNQQSPISNPTPLTPLYPPEIRGELKGGLRKVEEKREREISLLPKFEKIPEEKKFPWEISYLVIIVDDLGGNTAGTSEILSLNYPLTLAIIPYLSRSREIAEEAHRRGFEVIVHLPLEAEDEKYNKKNQPITVDMLDSKMQEETRDALVSIPHSVGFNNHQGSKFTTSISAMRNILKVAKESDFFYIDSLTSPYTVGELVAKGVGIRFGKRDIFLDNVKDKDYIKEQFGQLINIAKRKGKAVGMCHVSQLTYEVLKKELPRLSEQNIKLVFASEVVE